MSIFNYNRKEIALVSQQSKSTQERISTQQEDLKQNSYEQGLGVMKFGEDFTATVPQYVLIAW